MQLTIDDELRQLLLQLASRHWSLQDWCQAEAESFESEHYCGGFDADEQKFCFSRYAAGGNHCWFEFEFSQLEALSCGELSWLPATVAEGIEPESSI